MTELLPVKFTPLADAHVESAARWWLNTEEQLHQAFEELERGTFLKK